MTVTRSVSDEEVVEHFTARASRYDRSSHWVDDPALAFRVLEILDPGASHTVLDVACGTGLWARIFRDRGLRVIGVDVTPAMYRQAHGHLSGIVDARAEDLPFRDGVFDIATVRQGIQFTDAAASVREMARVTRRGGRLCLVQLCAYGPGDREEYFEILRLRNPARRNFFLREDLEDLLRGAGCTHIRVHDHVTEEDVEAWADNGAIDDERQRALRAVYDSSSPSFRELHAVRTVDGRHVDRMLFGIAVGVRP